MIRNVKRESVAANGRDGASRRPSPNRHVLGYKIPDKGETLEKELEVTLKLLGIGGEEYLNHDCSKQKSDLKHGNYEGRDVPVP